MVGLDWAVVRVGKEREDWQEARIPESVVIPFQDFTMHYKLKAEYGGGKQQGADGKPKMKQRLNVRVDLLFPGLDCLIVQDFLWNSFSNTDMQRECVRPSSSSSVGPPHPTPPLPAGCTG